MLLAHPAVAEAVCFGVPHPTWGEEVSAAVVLKETATEADLLAYCKERLADFKRPKQIHITDDDSAHRHRQDSAPDRGAGVRAKSLVRIVIAGAGAIGGYIGAQLARPAPTSCCSRADRTCARCRSAACACAAPTATSRSGPGSSPDDLPSDRSRRRRLSRRQGAQPHGARADARAALRPRHGRRQHAERHPVVVFPESRRRVRRSATRARRSWRRHRRAIEPRRVVGSLAYFATDIAAPGVIHHTEGNRISFGEPDGTRSERARAIAEALIAAGFRCPMTTRIRHEIWVKLLGNVAFNPISALTGGTLEELARDPECRASSARS